MRIIHPIQVIDGDQRFTHRRGSSGVLLSSSIIENLTKENEMFEMTFNGLVSLLGNPLPTRKFEKEMLTYAKTEYGKDWQYAFHYMLTHKGKGPRMGVTV
jgi:hypothetical protein